MKFKLLLAALPFVGMYSGGSIAEVRPLLFGLPFLLVWNLIWMAATAAILAILFHLDERGEGHQARDGRTGDAR
ncbi:MULTISPECIES: DUF3311 domain-containing protein [Burkholderia]|uniref:DUF3311 domain-containing protein n=1 Tax=Burkholderia diffusa TaxID=488732 RepID=A0A6P2QG81_9BURK|nr:MULTISPECIES: DUF3311 domain-containing protein [Burkholderia]AOI95933.1 hypothetical protein WS66_10025 [Burkholderia sp. LA-2-3-30-S1-D2]KAB0651358.1 DUF3311 domain-containing protein [Burkholderia diffusa]KVE16129.1 hypothetical protein WS66_06970 [Burkholderia sp. LA-2-3-30-S1-D2]MBM2651907.1 DUF3311 domain-containing protein [Burkholderia diffusa]VWC20905.1 hypothetical protein BDI24065_05853 [Burkholderia diffusa]